MSEHKGNFASCSSFQNAFQAEHLMNTFTTLLNDGKVGFQNVRFFILNSEIWVFFTFLKNTLMNAKWLKKCRKYKIKMKMYKNMRKAHTMKIWITLLGPSDQINFVSALILWCRIISLLFLCVKFWKFCWKDKKRNPPKLRKSYFHNMFLFCVI